MGDIVHQDNFLHNQEDGNDDDNLPMVILLTSSLRKYSHLSRKLRKKDQMEYQNLRNDQPKQPVTLISDFPPKPDRLISMPAQ